MKKSFFTLFFIFFLPVYIYAEEIIKKGETLNLKRCIETAQKNHPDIIAAKSTIDANSYKIDEAKSNYYPQVTGNAGYNRISGNKISNNTSDQYSTSLNINQTLYDFNKTDSQVNIQKFNKCASENDLEKVMDKIIFNVKQSYFGVLQAKKNIEVAKDSIKQFEQHLEQAKEFFKVGTKPKFDVTKAQVDLGNAKLDFIKSENALNTSKVKLDNAMGFADIIDYDIEDNLSFDKYDIALNEAIDKAYNNRADLKSLLNKKEVFKESVELSKKGLYPVLSGNANYNFTGADFPLEDNWSIGITLSVPIFNGFLTTNQIKESNSNLAVLKANEKSLRQQIYLEVKQAYLNLQQAKEAIPVANLSVAQADENLSLASNRYKTGVGSLLEVTDAEVAYIRAKTAYIQALYDYKTAQANLEEAMSFR